MKFKPFRYRIIFLTFLVPLTLSACVEAEVEDYYNTYPPWGLEFRNLKQSDTCKFITWWPVAQANDDKDHLVRMAMGNAIIYAQLNDQRGNRKWEDTAMELLSYANDSLRRVAMLELGRGYRRNAEPVAALKTLKRLEVELSADEDPMLFFEFSNSLAIVFSDLNDLELCKKTSQKALKILGHYELPNDDVLQHKLILLNNIASYFTKSRQLDSALYYYQLAEDIDHGNKKTIIRAYIKTNIAELYTRSKQYDKAAIYLRQADSLNALKGYENFFTDTEHGHLMLYRGEVTKGIKRLHRQLEKWRGAKVLDQELNCLEYLADGYAINQQPQLALQYLREAKNLKDSIARKNGMASSLQVLQQFLLAEEQNKQLQLSFEKEVAISQTLRIRNYLIAVAALLIIALLWGVWLRRARKALKASQLSLEHANQELQASEHLLSEANLAKEQLLGVVGHDLRGSLAQSRERVTQLLERQTENLPANEVHSNLKAIDYSLLNTQNLMYQLVNWAAYQNERIVYTPAPLELQNIIAEEAEFLAGMASKANVFLDFVCTPMWVESDARMLRFIIRNLLHNAIKFSEPGQTVSVTTCATPEGECLLKVKDYGRGMTLTEQQKLFDIGAKINYGANGQVSYGLGLHLAQKFTQAMEARLLVESAPNKGSTFTLVFPQKIISPGCAGE